MPSWIDPAAARGHHPAGRPADGDRPIEPAPGVVVGGVGVRFSRASGPLLDAGRHRRRRLPARLRARPAATAAGVDLGGGARVEIAGLGVPLGGGGDGSNPVAEGAHARGRRRTTTRPRRGSAPPWPSRSIPAATSRSRSSPGPAAGPWWLAIQREFGPIYLEQVGLAVDQDGTRLKAIGVLIDGKVSLFGLSAAVDDLSFTYTVDGARLAARPAPLEDRRRRVRRHRRD